MTPREKEILDLIRDNPMISQKEIAEKFNITRSSVSVHILNLSSKGLILGRGYIFSQNPYVAVIGGSCVDIAGIPNNDFKLRDSNIGHINYSNGGVGRNIAENLARLNVKVGLITAIGKDVNGNQIRTQGEEIGIDFNNAFVIDNEPTAIYLSILDEDKDMIVAINQMDINNKMTPDLLYTKKDYITSAKIAVLDTNLSNESLKFLLTEVKRDYIIDSVSVAKASKLFGLLDKIHTLKCNVYEAQLLSNVNIKKQEDIKSAGERLLQLGVKNAIITWGENGVYLFNSKGMFHYYSKPIKAKNATGAGDAFTAALTFGYFMNWNIEQTLKFAVAASRVTLLDENTISNNFNYTNIKEEEGEIKC